MLRFLRIHRGRQQQHKGRDQHLPPHLVQGALRVAAGPPTDGSREMGLPAEGPSRGLPPDEGHMGPQIAFPVYAGLLNLVAESEHYLI